jgi:hypothetical protein
MNLYPILILHLSYIYNTFTCIYKIIKMFIPEHTRAYLGSGQVKAVAEKLGQAWPRKITQKPGKPLGRGPDLFLELHKHQGWAWSSRRVTF